MLIVAGEIRIGSADDYEKARAALTRMMAETHKETGCHDYAFSQCAADPCTIRLFEKWEDQAALDAHMQTQHMADFNKEVASFGIVGADVHVYEVSGSRKLM